METFIPFLVLGITGIVLGLGLALAFKYLAVEEDPRFEQLMEMLPGYNCGACGKPGCSGFATAIIEGEVNDLKLCKPCKPDAREGIKNYLAETQDADGNTIAVKA